MKKRIALVISVFIVILALVISLTVRISKPAVASTEVNYGEFVIKVIEAGEITSIISVTVSGPPVQGRLQITKLIKDGSHVKKGDVLVEFDKGELQQEMLKSLSDLKLLRMKSTRSWLI